MNDGEKKIPRTPDSRRHGAIDQIRAPVGPTPLWHVDDRVRFAHGPGPFTISAVLGDMVELKELPGQFAEHLFVGLDVQRFD